MWFKMEFSKIIKKSPSEMSKEEVYYLLCTLDGCGQEKKKQILDYVFSGE